MSKNLQKKWINHTSSDGLKFTSKTYVVIRKNSFDYDMSLDTQEPGSIHELTEEEVKKLTEKYHKQLKLF